MEKQGSRADEVDILIANGTPLLSEIDPEAAKRLTIVAQNFLMGMPGADREFKLFFERRDMALPADIGEIARRISEQGDFELPLPEETEEVIRRLRGYMSEFMSKNLYPSPHGAFLKIYRDLYGRDEAKMSAHNIETSKIPKGKKLMTLYAAWRYAEKADDKTRARVYFETAFTFTLLGSEKYGEFTEGCFEKAEKCDPSYSEKIQKIKEAARIREECIRLMDENKNRLSIDEDFGEKAVEGIRKYYLLLHEIAPPGFFARDITAQAIISAENELRRVKLEMPIEVSFGVQKEDVTIQKLEEAMILSRFGGKQFFDAFARVAAHLIERKEHVDFVFDGWAFGENSLRRDLVANFTSPDFIDASDREEFEVVAYAYGVSRGDKKTVREKMARIILGKTIISKSKNNTGIELEDIERLMDKVVFLQAIFIDEEEAKKVFEEVVEKLETMFGEAKIRPLLAKTLSAHTAVLGAGKAYIDIDGFGEEFYREAQSAVMVGFGSKGKWEDVKKIKNPLSHFSIKKSILNRLATTRTEEGQKREMESNRAVYINVMANMEIWEFFGYGVFMISQLHDKKLRVYLYKTFFQNCKDKKGFIKSLSQNYSLTQKDDKDLSEGALRMAEVAEVADTLLAPEEFGSRPEVLDMVADCFFDSEPASLLSSAMLLSVVTSRQKDPRGIFRRIISRFKKPEDLLNIENRIKINQYLLEIMPNYEFARMFITEFSLMPMFDKESKDVEMAMECARTFFRSPVDFMWFMVCLDSRDGLKAHSPRKKEEVPQKSVKTREADPMFALMLSEEIKDELRQRDRTEQIQNIADSLRVCKKRVMGDEMKYKTTFNGYDTPLGRIFKSVSIKKARTSNGKIAYTCFLSGQNKDEAYSLEVSFDEENGAGIVFRRKGMVHGKPVSRKEPGAFSVKFLEEIEYMMLVFLKTFYDKQPEDALVEKEVPVEPEAVEGVELKDELVVEEVPEDPKEVDETQERPRDNDKDPEAPKDEVILIDDGIGER